MAHPVHEQSSVRLEQQRQATDNGVEFIFKGRDTFPLPPLAAVCRWNTGNARQTTVRIVDRSQPSELAPSVVPLVLPQAETA